MSLPKKAVVAANQAWLAASGENITDRIRAVLEAADPHLAAEATRLHEDRYALLLECVTNADDTPLAREISEILAWPLEGVEKPLSEVLAVVWERGFRSGKSVAMRHMSDEPGLSLNVPNPYRPCI